MKFVERGATAIKLRMQIREHYQNPEPDPTFEYARAVRKAIGDGIDFWVDGNNGYTAARAIEVGKRLAEEVNIRFFEDRSATRTTGRWPRSLPGLDVPDHRRREGSTPAGSSVS